MALAEWEYAGMGAVSADLGLRTATGATDHVDVLSRDSRVYVSVANGLANSTVVEVEGSHDGSAWGTLTLGFSEEGVAVTQRTVAAATTDFVFLDPQAVPRFLRVNVATANANGAQVDVLAERSV